MDKISCFKSYDIRGKIPSEINNSMAYKIGFAFSKVLQAKKVVIGRDVRLSGEELQKWCVAGLNDAGSQIVDIGVCGTEEIYHQCFSNLHFDGGIMITASHNPKDYNGMKFVSRGSYPISLEDKLGEMQQFILQNQILVPNSLGKISMQHNNNKQPYIEHLLGYVDLAKLSPLKIVANPGNGPAGIIVKMLEKYLPFEFYYVQEEPDGNFPNGVPNPMIEANQAATSNAVIEHKADFGIAWDGDFDRCFFFDEKGRFINGYYIVGLLAQNILSKRPGGTIIHDPRLVWNSLDIIKQNNGIAVQSKSGHSFIKKKMREVDGIYGGEISAHHYFKEFGYSDSGMIPWLIMAEIISVSGLKLSDLIADRMQKYSCRGEFNYETDQFDSIRARILREFKTECEEFDEMDGLSMSFKEWRFNLRKSNTENLVRLNLESVRDFDINQKMQLLEDIIWKKI